MEEEVLLVEDLETSDVNLEVSASNANLGPVWHNMTFLSYK